MLREEEVLQRDIVTYFDYLANYNKLQGNAFLFSIRNENSKGKSRGIVSGKIYKMMGRRAGVSDLALLYNGKPAFIELKTPKAYKMKNHNLSVSQQTFFEEILKPQNIAYKVVDSVDMFHDFLATLDIIK